MHIKFIQQMFLYSEKTMKSFENMRGMIHMNVGGHNCQGLHGWTR